MVKVTCCVFVDRKAGEAFSFVATNFFSNLHKWNPTLLEVKQLSRGPVGVGTAGWEVQRIQERPYERNFEVVEYEPDVRFAVASTEPPSKETYRSSYTVREIDGKTEIMFDFEYDAPGLFFRMFDRWSAGRFGRMSKRTWGA